MDPTLHFRLRLQKWHDGPKIDGKWWKWFSQFKRFPYVKGDHCNCFNCQDKKLPGHTPCPFPGHAQGQYNHIVSRVSWNGNDLRGCNSASNWQWSNGTRTITAGPCWSGWHSAALRLSRGFLVTCPYWKVFFRFFVGSQGSNGGQI